MPKEIEKLIPKLVSFLENEQRKDGSFLDYAWKMDSSKKIERHTTFSSSLILTILAGLEKKVEIKKITKRTSDFLLKQKSPDWTYNYWVRDSEEARNMPYPDDLDDTFCALSALYIYNEKSIDGKVLANMVNILTFLEKKEGGPYTTWIVPPEADETWKDVDLAVNSNVAFFLSLQDVYLPNIEKLVEDRVFEKKISSPYYFSMYSVIYYISRFYKGKAKDDLIKIVFTKKKNDETWGNPLDTALSISSLLNFEVDPKSIEKSIIALIQFCEKGILDAYPFVIESSKNKNTFYSGSPALTTAFCLETLNKYLDETKKKSSSTKRHKNQEHKDRIKKEIIGLAKKRFSNFDDDFKKTAYKVIDKITKKDYTEQITLLPYFFAISVKESKTSDDFFVKTGLANLFGWIAYDIYDDFLDNEGSPNMLALANVSLREVSAIYLGLLPENEDFKDLFTFVMDRIENANFWETSSLRARIQKNEVMLPNTLPKYKDKVKLSDKSLGHALGPIAVLMDSGFDSKSDEIKNTISMMEHYIAAKQLSDDMHDWEEDLKMGILTKVNIEVIKKWQANHKGKNINIKKNVEELQKIFWYEFADMFANEVLKSLKQSREALKNISAIRNYEFFNKITKNIEGAAKKAIVEREKMIEFLKTFDSKT